MVGTLVAAFTVSSLNLPAIAYAVGLDGTSVEAAEQFAEPAEDESLVSTLATTEEEPSDEGTEVAAAAEDEADTVKVAFKVADAVLTYTDAEGTEHKIEKDTDGVELASDADFAFTVEANEGFEVSRVVLVAADDEAELTVGSDGNYVAGADQLVDGAEFVVETAGEVIDAGDGVTTFAITGQQFVEVGSTITLNSDDFHSHAYEHVWNSSDPAKATVRGNNKSATVSGLAPGEVTITHEFDTYADGHLTESYVVTVIPNSSITITPSSLTLTEEGDTGHLSAEPIGDFSDNATVSWTSNNESIAKVDNHGVVTPLQDGTVTITASATTQHGKQVSGSATVTVQPKANFRIVYNSNYPEDAMKLVYSNGGASASLERAADTNAVYSYDPNATATISDGMSCANYEFLGWSTNPDAPAPDENYKPDTEIEMSGNITLYAVWGGKVEFNGTMSITVRYYGTSNSPHDYVSKETLAYVKRGGGKIESFTFVLGNNQDTIASDDARLRGWTHDDKQYEFNETLTTTEFKQEGSGHYVVEVHPWLDEINTSTAYAQFFVLKRGGSYGDADKYYSVGTGSIDVDKFNAGKGETTIYPEGKEDQNNDISEIIVSSPDPAQIASILNITLDEAESIRWYVAKDQSDGYHVDGVIYNTGKYWNVRFVDTKDKDVLAHYVVQDAGTVHASQFPEIKDRAFDCWVDEDGKEVRVEDITLVSKDTTIYTKYKDSFNITASIVDESGKEVGGTVSPAFQSVYRGDSSTAINFEVPQGYVIKKVQVDGSVREIG